MAGYAPAAPFHLTESEVIMNELITVNYDNEQPTVSARELHDFLEVGADFRHWFPRMCEYGFEGGRDFNPVKFDRVQYEGNREVRRTVDDAAITIDMAKELCMLQRNDKGKQARQYFLQLERDWNSPEKVMARALQIAHKRIHTLSEKIEQDAPKVLFADSVAASPTTILIFDLAKIVKQNGVDMGGKRLFAWMRDNGYLVRRQGTSSLQLRRLRRIITSCLSCGLARLRLTLHVTLGLRLHPMGHAVAAHNKSHSLAFS